MSAVLLDTHVVVWWAAEPERLSPVAVEALNVAEELSVAAITWYELAWLAHHQRIRVTIPIRSWLAQLAEHVRTLPITPVIATTAARLPADFPRDPADRLIFATAVEHGLRLVTKDERLRAYPHEPPVALW